MVPVLVQGVCRDGRGSSRAWPGVAWFACPGNLRFCTLASLFGLLFAPARAKGGAPPPMSAKGGKCGKFQSRWLLAPSDPASRPVGILPAPDMGPFPPNLPPMDQTSFVVDNSAPARILASAAVKSRPHTQFPQPDTLTRANDSRAPSAGSPSCAATRPWP